MKPTFDNFQSEDPKNHFDNYKYGLFYCNPSDKRIIVPKMNRYMGYTLNFSNPLSYVVLAILIGGAVIAALFLK